MRAPAIGQATAATMLALLDHARAACPEAPACYLRGYLVRAAGELGERRDTLPSAGALVDVETSAGVVKGRRLDPRSEPGSVPVGRVDVVRRSVLTPEPTES